MENKIDIFVLFLKLFVFTSTLITAGIMYQLGSIGYGNDLLLTAGLMVALNKLDNIA